MTRMYPSPPHSLSRAPSTTWPLTIWTFNPSHEDPSLSFSVSSHPVSWRGRNCKSSPRPKARWAGLGQYHSPCPVVTTSLSLQEELYSYCNRPRRTIVEVPSFSSSKAVVHRTFIPSGVARLPLCSQGCSTGVPVGPHTPTSATGILHCIFHGGKCPPPPVPEQPLSLPYSPTLVRFRSWWQWWSIRPGYNGPDE